MNSLTGLAVAALTLFIGITLGAVLGALSGWCVGLLFPDAFRLLEYPLGMVNINPPAQPYQIGAMLGFVAGFFVKKRA